MKFGEDTRTEKAHTKFDEVCFLMVGDYERCDYERYGWLSRQAAGHNDSR